MTSSMKSVNLLRCLLKRQIPFLQRSFSTNQICLNDAKNFEEDDWFKKLTDSTKIDTKNNLNSKIKIRQKFNELSNENKIEVIKNLWAFRKENGLPAPKELNDKAIEELLKCESLTHLTKTMIHMVKEEYYAYQKEQKKLDKLKREKRVVSEEPNVDVITNYPGRDTYLKRVNNTEVRRFNRSKVLTSILTDEPSIVFDFRYIPMHTRIEHIKSLYRQYIEIISANRNSLSPFQVHFCNYDYNTEFHKRYGHFLEYDQNLIFETPKSYLDIFPKDKLVYLSRDAKHKMTRYDPDKVYIIGSIIDIGDDRFKYYSYSQAKKDGIRCERLPLDDHVRWNRGQKSLNMDHMFDIFLNLKHGLDWRESMTRSLPSRKMNEFLHDDQNFRKHK